MTDPSSVERVVERLTNVLAAAYLPQNLANRGRRLLERLETPVRIAVLGMQEPSQPEVVNGLVGRDLVPQSSERPPQQIEFAATARVIVTRTDGSVVELAGEGAADLGEDVLFLQRECDAPALRRFSVLDLPLEGTPSEIQRALRWAASKADIAIWCSRTFPEAERALWSGVPDKLKDHAFLALTQVRDERGLSVLRNALSGEFLDISGIGGEVSDAGGQTTASMDALVGNIHRHINAGRQADAANALMFLQMNERTPVADAAASVAAQEPAETAQASVVDFNRNDAAHVPGAVDVAAQDPEFQAALRSACAYLKQRAEDLYGLLADNGTLDGANFVAQCGDTIRQLSSILDAAPHTAGADGVSLSEVLLEAEEMAILLEIERDGEPAVDAASVLLQLRYELESRLAA